ncbi:ADP-ribosylation_factor 1 [Hexamita inflata]|uniref:ADP-ribosylation factor 1 n=1 Tax=Hexamita inflata TaxID=28002 RepID=A0AA86NV98_9EUKA|nr:ADP-ribosylation factor 1 [Hexamita inflata]
MMNSAFGTLVSKIKYNQCVMVGHPLSGKKSLMQHYQLCPDEFSYYKSLKFNIWDLFNKDAPIMQYYFTNVKAVIFVYEIINLNSELLLKLSNYEELQNASFLILINKVDLTTEPNIIEIQNKLQTEKIKQKWRIQMCSAKTGLGVWEGLEWLDKNL